MAEVTSWLPGFLAVLVVVSLQKVGSCRIICVVIIASVFLVLIVVVHDNLRLHAKHFGGVVAIAIV